MAEEPFEGADIRENDIVSMSPALLDTLLTSAPLNGLFDSCNFLWFTLSWLFCLSLLRCVWAC